MRDEITAYFLGTTAKLTNDDVICTKAAWANRCRLVTVPVGKVKISVTVVLRNFKKYIDLVHLDAS